MLISTFRQLTSSRRLQYWSVLAVVLLGLALRLYAATHAEARLSEPLHPFLLIIIAGAAVTVWWPRLARRFALYRRRMEEQRAHEGAPAVPGGVS